MKALGATLAVVSLVTVSSGLWAEEVVTEPILTLSGHTWQISSVGFSPDGTKLITGSWDSTALLWDAASGAQISQFRADTWEVACVAFAPNGTRIITGNADGGLHLWDVASGSLIRTIRASGKPIMSVAFAPNGEEVLTGSTDNTARLWNVATGELIRTCSHADSVYCVAFSSDGTKVLTGSEDNAAYLWDAETGVPILTFSGHTGAVTAVAFSPDGTKVLTGSSDKTACIWDATTGLQIRLFSGFTQTVRSVAFSPDGSRILTASADARVWDAVTGDHILTFSDQTYAVTSASLSPDGTKVLTAGYDERARLWNATGQLLKVSSSPIACVSIDGDVAGVTDFSRVLHEAAQVVTLSAPPVVLDGNIRYDFVRWRIDDADQAVGELSVQFNVDHTTAAVAVYQIRKHALTVISEPVAGISIAGIITNSTLNLDDQQIVELSAPAVASVGGVEYGFIRWMVDGQEQPAGKFAVSLTMDADRIVVATYFRARLSVASSPFSGIHLWGTHGDTTPYEQIFLAPQDVTLSAQLRVFRASVPYNFAYWKTNGIAQQPRQTDMHVRVEADTAVEAVYHILGDANGDCMVNVLDLILIRNRLGKPIESGDNWRGDVNLDGSVDVLDLISTRNKLGTRCQ